MQQLLYPLRPVRRSPVGRDEVRVVGADRPVVRGDDVAFLGVKALRPVLEGDVSGPPVFVRPGGDGQAPLPLRPNGDAADAERADVIRLVGVEHVERRRHVRLERVFERVPVVRVVDAEEGLVRGVVRIERRPPQGDGLVEGADNVADDGAVEGASELNLDGLDRRPE